MWSTPLNGVSNPKKKKRESEPSKSCKAYCREAKPFLLLKRTQNPTGRSPSCSTNTKHLFPKDFKEYGPSQWTSFLFLCILVVGIFSAGSDTSSESTSKESIEEVAPDENAAQIVRDVTELWNKSMNTADLALYESLLSEVVWFYLEPLPKKEYIRHKDRAFRKDPKLQAADFRCEVA